MCLGRAVSRILSDPQKRARESFVSAADTRDLLRSAEREAGRLSVPYLALHPMGFSVPPRLLLGRWALTPPFHPYPAGKSGVAVCSLWHCPSRRLAATSPARAPVARVARHRALWCSDFPPPANRERFSTLPRPAHDTPGPGRQQPWNPGRRPQRCGRWPSAPSDLPNRGSANRCNHRVSIRLHSSRSPSASTWPRGGRRAEVLLPVNPPSRAVGRRQFCQLAPAPPVS